MNKKIIILISVLLSVTFLTLTIIFASKPLKIADEVKPKNIILFYDDKKLKEKDIERLDTTNFNLNKKIDNIIFIDEDNKLLKKKTKKRYFILSQPFDSLFNTVILKYENKEIELKKDPETKDKRRKRFKSFRKNGFRFELVQTKQNLFYLEIELIDDSITLKDFDIIIGLYDDNKLLIERIITIRLEAIYESE